MRTKTFIIMMVAILAFPLAVPAQDPASPPVPEQPAASTPKAEAKPDQAQAQADKLAAMEAQIKALQEQLAAAKQGQAQPTGQAVPGNPPMAEAPQAAPAPKEQYAPGPIVYVKKASSADMPPEADFGTFISKDSAWSLHGLSKEIKFGSDTPAYDVQGFLVAKESGTYQIAVDQAWDISTANYYGFWKPLFTKIVLEGNTILQQSDKLTGQKGELRHVGAAKLDPGIYSLRIWTGGVPRDDLGQGTVKWVKGLSYKILVKAPGDMQFREPHPDEIVHRVAVK